MKNELSVKCPSCGRDDNIQIEARVWFHLPAGGGAVFVEESMYGAWKPEDEDGAACLACDWRGKIKEFD
ncbi:hypothetical protein [Roseovarius sp.]|uniref:hypothetical protein n=1 Tax=Roseovarius sp. TaxID=1486281 RepID=UPI003B5AFBB4